ncbi:DUF4251 domain-containing protein [Mucilaginibacter sp. UR6-1]|uniref:DUF4251 domain-containing protein n=1 Tax=Mucilaginibacter sp. UR6-1 TaxID=1435643 RepID=UPI001E409F3B|nr:DUF4251 domain-containing protein [Mucilaginibacter sp. UR6-1]MCC8407969.1 DUF4251 domain-containing protein [Mucilaginibacter sp. UR6-1]
MKNLIKIFFIAFLGLAVNTAFAQNTKADKKAKQEQAVKGKIDSVKYTFVAQWMNPMGGRQVFLTPANSYDIKIRKDSVIAFLPYFGRVYMNAPLAGEDGGIKFTSTKFDYKITPKKDRWQVIINFKDTRKARRLTMDVFKNGTATANIISDSRDPIYFQGNIDIQI